MSRQLKRKKLPDIKEKVANSQPDRVADKLGSVSRVLKAEYTKKDSAPWVIAYSGGKDSTLLLHLVWEVLLALPEKRRNREVHVIGNDTLVESPLVINHLKRSMEVIRKASKKNGLPIQTHLTEPYVDQTFWVNVIGRGYIPPTRNFRWCTDRMKIVPTDRLLESLVSEYERVNLLIGTRRSESQNRRTSMKKHGVQADTMNPHDSIDGCFLFAPLADLDDEDVWKILIQRKPPWGGTHRNLITLYRNAGGGECPLVLTKEDAPSCGTTSPRFGCWTCTVVAKDRSMRGVIDSGHKDHEKLESLADFREWLIELREDDNNRLPVRRDGKTKFRTNKTRVMGPFRIEVREKILFRLKKLQKQIGEVLITPSEIEVIKDIWWRDQIREDARQVFQKNVGLEDAIL
ncbi:MAG: DNA phosphorothioation system sulfurtransferase DndC [Thermodesulfobacteriota bacterium]